MRDGLNLVAKESAIINERNAGLVLSDRAGAAAEGTVVLSLLGHDVQHDPDAVRIRIGVENDIGIDFPAIAGLQAMGQYPGQAGGNQLDGDCCDGACGFEATGSPCLDDNACNGDELCNAAGACIESTPLACDDGVACTVDTCSAGICSV